MKCSPHPRPEGNAAKPSHPTHPPLQTTRVAHNTPAGPTHSGNLPSPLTPQRHAAPPARPASGGPRSRASSFPSPPQERSGASEEKKSGRKPPLIQGRAERASTENPFQACLRRSKRGLLPGALDVPTHLVPAAAAAAAKAAASSNPHPLRRLLRWRPPPPQLSLQQRPRAHARGTPGTPNACAFIPRVEENDLGGAVKNRRRMPALRRKRKRLLRPACTAVEIWTTRKASWSR